MTTKKTDDPFGSKRDAEILIQELHNMADHLANFASDDVKFAIGEAFRMLADDVDREMKQRDERQVAFHASCLDEGPY